MLFLSSCAGEFNRVYKSADNSYKYEYAKEAFANNKFQQASVLLEELVTLKKASDEAQECLYMLGMAQYCNGDFEAASATFKKYGSTYPRGTYAEAAAYYVGQALYESAPSPVSTRHLPSAPSMPIRTSSTSSLIRSFVLMPRSDSMSYRTSSS